MVSTQVTKVAVLVGLALLTFLFSMLPLKLVAAFRKQGDPTKARNYRIAISLLSCYAAGVFLGTCLLDLFPEVRSKINEGLQHADQKTSFPVAEFVMVFGLFIILMTEQLVLQYNEGSSEGYSPVRTIIHDHEDVEHGSVTIKTPSQQRSNPQKHTRRYRSIESEDAQHHKMDESSEYESDNDARVQSHELLRTQSVELTGFYEDPNSESKIRALILLIALSLHSVFEGLAVGLQPTSSKVLGICAALLLHKSILAFSLGLNLVQSKLSLWGIIRSNLVFSFTAPLGIGIGIGITDVTKDAVAASLINGILQGLACGTFLYVTFFEILPHEFNAVHHVPHRMLKLLFVILGYGTVTGVLFLDPALLIKKGHDGML